MRGRKQPGHSERAEATPSLTKPLSVRVHSKKAGIREIGSHTSMAYLWKVRGAIEGSRSSGEQTFWGPSREGGKKPFAGPASSANREGFPTFPTGLEVGIMRV